MTARRLALVLVLVTVVASIGVGAAAPGGANGDPATPTTPANATAGGLGTNISMFLAASVAQTSATVENGMWDAAFAHAETNATKRALLEERFGDLNATVAQLRAERQALRVAYRNGTINRTTYRARMASLAGRLAALGESLDTVGERGRALGVNTTRLETLRSAASELGGGEVAAIARNLTGGRGPPGHDGIFDGDGPGRAGDSGGPPANATNRSNDPGPPDDAGGPPANRSERPTDAGPPDDPGNRDDNRSDGDDRSGRDGDGGQDAKPDDPGNRDDNRSDGSERSGGEGDGASDDRGNNPPTDDRRNDDGRNGSNRSTSTGPPNDPGDGGGEPPDDPGKSRDDPTATEPDDRS